MKLNFLKEFSLPKLVGRFGILIVDTFSTLIFFMLQGNSWVLTTTGAIFAVTKVWHWQQSFKAVDKLRRFLHRGAWFLMAVLSVYFLITLGLSITQTPEEEMIDQNISALEQAIAKSRVANVESLTKEQDSLLRQNDGLTERLLTLNQWSQAWEPIQSQINANLLRLGVIAGELNKIYTEQTTANEVKGIEKEKENTTIFKFRAVKPIGAENLIGRVVPRNWINASIVLLFFFIGIVMEITLALSSLQEEKHLHPEPKKDAPEINPPIPSYKNEIKTDTPNFVQRLNKKLKELTPAQELPEGLQERKGYNSEEILAYIEAAYDSNYLKPDNEVLGISEADCQRIRKYLQSFKLRGKIIVEEKNGVYVVKLDKDNLKKFIALQCSVQRI